MSNSVERVKAICAQKKIAISKLEKDLGFGNGYIGQLRKGVFPDDRLVKIAEYLSVPVDYLLTGNNNEKTPASSGERLISDDDLIFALWGDTSEMGKADLEDVKEYAAFVRERKKRK